MLYAQFGVKDQLKLFWLLHAYLVPSCEYIVMTRQEVVSRDREGADGMGDTMQGALSVLRLLAGQVQLRWLRKPARVSA